MDFTVKTYIELLEALIREGSYFKTFTQYIEEKPNKVFVLRHDVDLLPNHSLRFAKIQAEKGISGSYFFRAVPESWDESIIKEIAGLGHEIGYHYEDLTLENGNVDKAYDSFCRNLDDLRKLADVSTICMHGSPASPYDSKDIWKKYDYRKLGIIGEPYFDIDFSKIYYLTDTGRCWDGYKVSVRDKIPKYQDLWIREGFSFHSTQQVISGVKEGRMQKGVMFTFHPQRWHNSFVAWSKELVFQNLKNIIKKHFFVKRSH
ncbi:MAG: hypothetical protein C0594_04265 [Marinilabiliales bacterium]|nr:MAG: hypothetical protein C0594_04265 [Marinilabiliales bacterium]